jgi:signal transduction histidine kinase
MIRSIRLRIGLSVLGVTLALLVAQGLWMLRRFEEAGRDEVDSFLRSELSELAMAGGEDGLRALIRSETASSRPREEVFFEVRDASGRVLAASDDLPSGGLGRFRARGPRPEFWERTHPSSDRGHRLIRVADARVGGLELRVAHSLEAQQDRYWDLREDLLVALAIVTALASGMAWAVAARALAPVGRMIDRARALGTETKDLLPRSGKGDELDRLAAVLNELLTRLREQVERTRRLSADASHALRTPLTTVRGNLELLATERPDSEPLQEALQQVQRLDRMVSGLLDLERLAQRGLEEPPAPLDLASMVEEIAADFSLAAAERGIGLRTVLQRAVVRGHEQRLSEAIANLLDNALRHAREGGTVRIEVGTAGDRARVSVTDDGPGFDPADAERLFERFYSIGTSGTGTGLGLAITRAIARAHGGDASATSGPDGSTFRIDLPRLGPDGPAPG